MPTDAKTAANTASTNASTNRASANHANAQHSTGPRTDDGKARSSQNALRHGLASGKLIIAGEDPAEFDAVHQELVESFVPSNIAERMLLEQMAQQWWLMQRALRLQQETFSTAEPGALPSQLALLIRYHSAAERAYHRALKSLLDIRKAAEQTNFRLMSLRKPANVSAAAELDEDPMAEYREYMQAREQSEALARGQSREREKPDLRPRCAA